MTIEEFYEWAKAHNVEKYEIEIEDDAFGNWWPDERDLTINEKYEMVEMSNK